MPRRPNITLSFLLVVGLCLAQIGWWVLFQYRESGRYESNQRSRLHATCFMALVSLRDHLNASSDDDANVERLRGELTHHYPELELKESNDSGRLGARIGDLLPHSALADYWILPSDSALGVAENQMSRTRRMFTAEGITFSVLVLFGVFLIYATMRSEARVHRRHEMFLAGATHELKTPLASIKLGLQTLEQGRSDPEQTKRYIHQMIGQIDRLEMEVTNLLNSAAGDGRQLQLSDGSFADDVRAVIDDFEPRLGARDVSVDLTAGDESIHITRDPEAIRLVLRNLIDNALKFSPHGGVIRITLSSEGDDARLLVDDQGPGIPADERELIFNRFYRGDSRPVESRGGAGLGLYLAHSIVARHGGSLTVLDSDDGARFEVRIPLASREVAS